MHTEITRSPRAALYFSEDDLARIVETCLRHQVSPETIMLARLHEYEPHGVIRALAAEFDAHYTVIENVVIAETASFRADAESPAYQQAA